MGLLDDLLTGLGGQPNAGRSMGQQTNQPQAPAGGGGMNQVMAALLPVVIAMLANRSAGASQTGSGQVTSSTSGGGLADVIGAALGGSSGGGGMGGLGAILARLQQTGYGEQANSWVSRGQNLPLPPDAMDQVFGGSGLADIARRAGVSETDARRGLSQLLPEVVDHVTPDGQVPDLDSLAASVDALTRRSQMR
jgi:uncharacterized protein YidB (DUF937 family)